MIKKNIIRNEFLRLTCFILIIGVSIGYSLWIGWFPKLSLTLPFLDFPVFIGEIILGFTLGLYLIHRCMYDRRFSQTDALWLIYLTFVGIKAFSGYFEYGPLALRNAALFYYPLFAVIMGWAIDRKYFHPLIISSMTVFVVVYLVIYPVLYFATPMLLIGFILARSHPNKFLRWGFYAVLLINMPVKSFFYTVRTIMVSNAACFLLLSILFFATLHLRKRWKLLCIVIALGGLSAVILTQSDLNNLRSMMNPGQLWERYLQQKKTAETGVNEVILSQINTKNPILFNVRKEAETMFYFSNKEKLIDLSHLPKREFIPRVDSVSEFIPMENTLNKSLVEKEKADLSGNFMENDDTALSLNEEPAEGMKIHPPINSEKMKSVIKSIEGLSSFTGRENSHLGRRDVMSADTNTLFRIYIWEDMITEVISQRAWMGRPFGYPFLSKKLLYHGWGFSEWMRDGWVAAHNSYVEYVYRSGIIGVLLIFGMFGLWGKMAVIFVKQRNVNYIILSSVLVYWMAAACFGLVFEVPYFAIPFWGLWGIAYAYYRKASA